MVQDAEGGGNPHDEENRKDRVQNVTRSSTKEEFKYLCVNSGDQQDARGKRHTKEKLDLMVQQTSVIQNPHSSDDSCARQNSDDLCASGSTKRKEHREHHGPVHRQPPQ